jgi:hypothetical protein
MLMALSTAPRLVTIALPVIAWALQRRSRQAVAGSMLPRMLQKLLLKLNRGRVLPRKRRQGKAHHHCHDD